MQKEIDKKDDENKNICFICNKTRNDCIMEKENNFEDHLKKHDIWKYIKYICNIILKNKDDYTEEEYYVFNQIKKRKLDWFPLKEKKKIILKIKNILSTKSNKIKFYSYIYNNINF